VTTVVSNRGPYRFVRRSDGTFAAQRGAGGMAGALGPLLTGGAAGPSSAWIAAALGDDDRAAVQARAVEVPGIALTLLDLDPNLFHLYYDLVSNGTLWFLHHGLFDLSRRPRFDRRFREAWAAYEAVNQAFADATIERATPGDNVLVQDYHLALVPGLLRAARPDLHVVHFTHTAFCGPNSARVLPTAVAEAIFQSMASGTSGFHAARWAKAYEASAREILGSAATIGPTFTATLGPDRDALNDMNRSDEVAQAAEELTSLVGDRALLLRVDRIDPSKNIVRGFAAYDILLTEHPELRERVIFLARLTISRHGVPDYVAYRMEVEAAAEAVNERWGTRDWQPVVIETSDDFARTVAAYQRYDVLLVNPVKDGLNLVAKEGPIVNERNGVLCLSPDAGAWDELQAAAIAVHPFDVEQTAAAVHRALVMGDTERATRATELRALAGRRGPRDWLDDQLKAARAQ
jgi:trehalose 6-phosphate synthase